MQRHDTLLIACGSQESRNHLRSVLKNRFNLLEASNTRQMLLLLEHNLHCIAAVVLDISNWDVIDEGIQTDDAAVALLKQRPVIIVSDKEDLTHYLRYGAADVMPLSYDPYAMIHRIDTIAQLTLHKKNLEATVAEQEENLRHFSDNMVDALSSIIEYRDADSGHHILRIRNFTRILMEEVMRHCPEYDLTPRLVSIISSASALHDVGKIGIPDVVLNKPGKLNKEEWEIMKTHAVLGCRMINQLASTVDREYLRYAYHICRHHHERWDGSGYPDGLKGEDIPICAQVVGLADCYDALTSDRVYKRACSHVQAVNMILGGECGAFSPKLQECFKNVVEQFDSLSREYADGRSPELPIADMSLPATVSPEQTINLIEKTQAKYYAIVHYLNALLIEVQLDTGLFQVMYNPYPELADFRGATSLQEILDLVLREIVVPEEAQEMEEVFNREIPEFVRQDMRRRSFYFHYRPYSDQPGGAFEMTLMRIGANLRPSLAVLCRKVEQSSVRSQDDSKLIHMPTECTYVCRNDSGFTLVQPGRDTRSFGGYSAQEVMDLFGGRLLDMAFPEERAAIRQEFDRQLRDSAMVRTEYRFPCKDGSIGWVVNKSRLVLGPDGQEYLQTFLFDITATKAAYDELRETMNRYKVILAQTENVLFDLNVEKNTIDFSDTWERIFGYKPSEAQFSRQLAGETHVHPDDLPALAAHLNKMHRGSDYEMLEIRIATSQGRYLWCRVRGSANRDDSGRLTRVVGIVINIDSEKQISQALEDKANRDSLTGLLNKNTGRRMVEQHLARSVPAPRCALIAMDLDNFKEVNDRYGHLFGDALLTKISQLLTSMFHSEDIIARIGGDEFMVLVQGVSDRQLLGSQCRRLRDMLVHTLQSDQIELNIGCSMGIALCPEDGDSYLELFSKADLALYQAKARGKNDLCFYSSGISMGYVPTSHFTTPIDSEMFSSITHQVFRLLNHGEDFEEAVNQALTIAGTKAAVSRVYVFENSEDNTYCRNTFEWCGEGIAPEIQNLQYLSYEEDLPSYQDNYGDEDVFYCHDIRDLDQSSYEILAPQGIKSMLHCAIRHRGVFRGYIGFDQCDRYRLWTKEEIQMLSEFSEILSAFLLRHREQERMEPRSYRVCRQTYGLKQVDGRILRQCPGLTMGDTCYHALMGRQTPCPGCPLQSLQADAHGWSVMEGPPGHGKLLMEAGMAADGDGTCIITCRRLPKQGW